MATLLRDFDEKLDNAVGRFVTEAFGAIAPSAVNVAAAAMTILVVFHGVRMMFGQSQAPLVDQFWLILRYGIVAAFLTSFSEYQFFVTNIVQNLPDSFGSALVTSSDGQEATLDNYWKEGMEAATVAYDDGGWRKMENYVFGFLIQIATVITTAIAFIIATLAKVGAALFLAFGPIAILCVMFQATRGIFEGWLRGLITFTLTQVFVVLAISLMLAVFSEFMDGLKSSVEDNDSRATAVGIFMLVAAITGLVIAQVPNFAIAVGGGISATTLGYGAAVASRAGRMATGAVSSTARGVRTGIVNKDNSPVRYVDKDGNVQFRSSRFNEGWRAGAITRAIKRAGGRKDQLAADASAPSRLPPGGGGAGGSAGADKVVSMDQRAQRGRESSPDGRENRGARIGPEEPPPQQQPRR